MMMMMMMIIIIILMMMMMMIIILMMMMMIILMIMMMIIASFTCISALSGVQCTLEYMVSAGLLRYTAGKAPPTEIP